MKLPQDYLVATSQTPSGNWKNRLAKETSPYLLQHAHNPVDWHPWGEEAFQIAKERDVPIFLSIGYAACHWCHVMEKESFEDPKIALLLNETFVNVKVDREERPDVDALYMDAIHAMGRHGGWPASIWMTPEGIPFYAGTYFPPTWRQGHPAFRAVIEQLQSAWGTNRERLLKSGDSIKEQLQRALPEDDGSMPGPHCIERGFEGIQEYWDDNSGGWGNGAKFPMPPSLSLLLRYGILHGKPKALVMIRKALDAMDLGGLHDHLGGGFHRYTVDPDWAVPHFEKMLYDNAQLLRVYAEAASALDDARYRDVVDGIVTYLERDLRLENGAYASSEDADSEGEEGVFYVWTAHEIHQRLHPAHAALFCRAYSVDNVGNFEHGTTVLRRNTDIDPTNPQLREVREKVLALRNQRERPARDDKAVVAWNALAAGALARAGRLLNRPDWIQRATELASLLTGLPRNDGLLPRTMDHNSPLGVLEDHAFLAEALLDVFEATGDAQWVQQCIDLLEGCLDHFIDDADGGFFRSSNPTLLLRQKSYEDGAEPSGASRMLQTLLRLRSLGHPLGEHSCVERGIRIGAAYLRMRPGSVPELLQAYDTYSSSGTEVVITAPSREAAQPFLMQYNSRLRFNSMIALVLPDSKDSLADCHVVHDKEIPTEGAYAFVCMDGACKLPIFDVNRLEPTLEEKQQL